jgi:hypothetical protein
MVEAGRIDPAAVRSPSDPYVYHGRVATVRSRLGPELAPYFARILREEADRLEELFGTGPAQRVTVQAHATIAEFRRHAGPLGIGSRTRGVWDAREWVIHLSVASVRGEPSDPRSVLLHEYVHFYLDACFGFPVPAALRAQGWPERLPTVPWWLQEGLAAQMENTWRDEQRESSWTDARQSELLHLIRTGRCPSVFSVLSKPPSAVGTSAEYAVAWGMVGALLHAADPDLRRSRRDALREYLSACGGGLPRHADADPAGHLLGERKDPDAAFGRWMEHVGKRSPELFRELIVGPGRSLEEWVRAWRREMLRRSGGPPG